jgi:hypothetical protein
MAEKKLIMPFGEEHPLDEKRDPEDIELATRARKHIDNFQNRDNLTSKDHAENAVIEKSLTSTGSSGVTKRTTATHLYNCHGLSFAGRRTRITDSKVISLILTEDEYEEVQEKQAIPGDLIIYFGEDGDFEHSGIVVEPWKSPLERPKIMSKWGSGPEFVHNVANCGKYNGANVRYYRNNKA